MYKKIIFTHAGALGKAEYPLLPGPLRPRVVAPDRILSIGKIVQTKTYPKLN